MGYLFLCIALLSGCSKGYCGKKTSHFTKGVSDAVLVNLVRMFFCCIIGAFVVFVERGSLDLSVGYRDLLISVLSGVSLSGFVVFWLVAVKNGAYMTVDISLTVGMLIPVVSSVILWGEAFRPTQIIGFIILLIAVVIMCSYNTQIKGGFSTLALVALVLMGVSNGVADFSQKMFVRLSEGTPVSVFNFYTYVFCTLTLAIVFAIMPKGDKALFEISRKEKTTLFSYILLMSALMFVNTYFKTLAASRLDAVILYPLNQGGGLMLSCGMSAFIFKEKITRRAAFGIVLAFVSLLIINLL